MIQKIIIAVSLLFSFNIYAVVLKVAVLAPEGTSWADSLRQIAQDVKKETGGEVEFKVYYGGTQGDEGDVLRKIRVGQLHGGVFTGRTLGEVNGDTRVMEIPFTFKHDRERALEVLYKMAPYFNQGFEKKGFKGLGYCELGLVYLGLINKFEKFSDLSGVKIWSWEGDNLVSTLINELNLVAVPLQLPDVLTSLSTGMLQAVYAPGFGHMAFQWNTKIKYMLDYPLSFATGAFLLDIKQWNKVPAKHKDIVEKITNKYFKEVSLSNAKENEDALKVMQASGVKMVKFGDADIKYINDARANVIKKLTGPLFSKDAYTHFEKILKEK